MKTIKLNATLTAVFNKGIAAATLSASARISHVALRKDAEKLSLPEKRQLDGAWVAHFAKFAGVECVERKLTPKAGSVQALYGPYVAQFTRDSTTKSVTDPKQLCSLTAISALRKDIFAAELKEMNGEKVKPTQYAALLNKLGTKKLSGQDLKDARALMSALAALIK